MSTKRAVYPVECKAIGDSGQVEALVSVFGNVDLQGDRVMPGAFVKSIAEWKQSGDPVPVVFSHEWGDVWSHIGVVDSLTETAKGLLARYTLDIADNPVAAQVYKLMKRRTLKEHSFAYDVESEHRAKDGANELTELRIIEVGPTLKGANPSTELLTVKSLLAAQGGKAAVPVLDPDEDPVAVAEAIDAVLDSIGDALAEGDLPSVAALLAAAEMAADQLLELLGGVDADDTKSAGAKAGRRLSQATSTELQGIRDQMKSDSDAYMAAHAKTLARMDALMGVAEDAIPASSGEPEGAKGDTAPNESEENTKPSTTEGHTAKSTDATVIALRTRISELRATTGTP